MRCNTKTNLNNSLGSFYDEQIACVSSSVMLSVAAIESNVNEYLSEPEILFPELNSHAKVEVCSLISTLSILDKYQKILAIKGIESFNKGCSPFQDVDILVSLRNELVHFHPEWHDEQERHKKLGAKLQYRFELSPFINETSSVIFPQRIVSHGYSKWAVESALTFMLVFSNKLKLENKFTKHKDKFKG